MYKKISVKIILWFITIALGCIHFQTADARDLLVGSYETNQILRYDGQTGDFVSVFISHPMLDGPGKMIFGPDGKLYVGSLRAHSVLRFNPQTGDFIDVFISSSSGGLMWPLGMLFGPDGNLYVCSQWTSQVLRYDGQTGDFIDVFAEGNGLIQPVDR